MISKQLIAALKEEQKELEALTRKVKRGFDGAPDGSVLVKRYKKGVQFYYRDSPSDRNGKYMPVSEKKRAVALIQKAYDKKVFAAASKQRSKIDSFLKGFDLYALQDVFEREGELRQK